MLIAHYNTFCAVGRARFGGNEESIRGFNRMVTQESQIPASRVGGGRNSLRGQGPKPAPC